MAFFGVCDEGNRSQVNYLIDGTQTCGKGANTVISVVHHFLQHFAQNREEIFLHADNYVGQNKNNALSGVESEGWIKYIM